MSYESQNELANDPTFRGRVRMCVAEQAEVFVNDGRVQYQQLANQAIGALDPTTDQFVPLVAVRPAMAADSEDVEILSAVQYVWPLVGARYTPAVVPPVTGP